MNILISHYDLDGVVSAIILHQGMKFDKMFKGGYHRFDSFIDQIDAGANVVVADCSFTVEQFTKLKAKANKIIYIDHHPDSIKIKETFTNDIVIFDPDKAGAGLCLDFITSKKELSKELKMLANAANFYDLFKREEQPNWFKFGYDLNILFWDYHFDAFFDRFKNGFYEYTSKEKSFLKESKIQRDKILADSTYIEIGDRVKGIICVPAGSSIQNDVPYYKLGYDVYYIIMRYPKTTSISVRTKEIDLTNFMHTAEYHPTVISAGGHPNASGITFHGQPSDEIIAQVIESLHAEIDRKDDSDDIPF